MVRISIGKLKREEREVVADREGEHPQRVEDVLPGVAVDLAERKPERSDVLADDLDAISVFSGRRPLPADLFDPADESEGDVDDHLAVFPALRRLEVNLVSGDRQRALVRSG